MCRSPSMVGSSAFLRVSATDTRGVHWNFFTVAIVTLVSSLLDSNNGEQRLPAEEPVFRFQPPLLRAKQAAELLSRRRRLAVAVGFVAPHPFPLLSDSLSKLPQGRRRAALATAVSRGASKTSHCCRAPG